LVCASVALAGCPSQKVVVLDQLPSIQVEQVWDDMVSFVTGAAKTPFEVGDIIASSADGGFLRRVTAINQKDGQVETETGFVSLAEAVESGTLNGSVSFNEKDLAKAMVPTKAGDPLTIDLSGLVIYSKDGVTLSITTGSIKYTPTLTLKADFSNHALTSFLACSDGDMTVDMNLRLQATAGKALNFETDVIAPITKPYVFTIGPIPVAGYASLRFPFGVSGSVDGTASLESGFDGTTHLKMGTQLADGKWTQISDFGQFSPNAHPLVASFSSGANLEVYVKPTATLDLYYASDLSGFVKPYIAADATFVPSPFLFVLDAGVDGGINYQLNIFDTKLVNQDWNFPGPKWELYRYSAPYDIPTTFTFQLP
jgi:hypothetical protein